MDLSDLKPKSDSIVVELVHPVTQEPLADKKCPMTITVYGPYSKHYKDAIHEQTNKRIAKSQKTKKVSFTSEEVEAYGLELLSKVTKEWNILLGGKCPELSVGSATEIYTDFPWIREQVEEAINDTASFMKA